MTTKNRWGQPLVSEPIGVAKFRMKLADYLKSVKTENGRIYPIGRFSDALLLSPDTLEQLEKRHAITMWMKKAYTHMDLTCPIVIANGIKTRELPKEVQDDLIVFFQLANEVMERTAQTVYIDHIAYWQVATPIRAAGMKNEEIKTSRVPFWSSIYTILCNLFTSAVYPIDSVAENDSIDIMQFFDRLNSVSFDEWHQVYDTRYLKNESLTKEQRMWLGEMIHEFCVWTSSCLWIQYLDIDYQKEDKIRYQYEVLKELYEKNIGDLPPVSFFPG